MNKAQLVNALVDAHGITKTQANDVVGTVLSTLRGSLAKGETVQLVGFGSFTVVSRAARKGRNPSTGEAIKIAATKRVRFNAGKDLREAVNKPAKKKK